MGLKAAKENSEIGPLPSDWQVLPLGTLARAIQYGSSAPSRATGTVPVLRMGNLQDGKLDWSDLVFTSDAAEIRKYELSDGDVLFNRTNTIDLVGKTSIYRGERKAIFAGYLIRVLPAPDKLDARYLNYVMNAEAARRHSAKVLSVAVGQANINGQKLRTYPIPLPPTLTEQRAIATALSDFDDLLEGLDRLIAKKRDLKQSAMQQLLAGRTRLPGFSGKWQEARLGEVAQMGSGGTPPSSVAAYYGGGIPWVSISDMTSAGKFIRSTENTLTRLGLANSAARMFPEGTVLYAMYASLGECSIAQLPVCTSQAILGIRPTDRLHAEFLYYVLTSLKSAARTLGQQGTQANLNKGIVQGFRLRLPEPAEQAAIAEVLSDMDAEIAALGARRDTTRALKQAMMQELLTGRTRLV